VLRDRREPHDGGVRGDEHDANGIIWPAAIAPYHVLITLMKPEDAKQQEVAKDLAAS
jgi:prolyl-tRNA synthetase